MEQVGRLHKLASFIDKYGLELGEIIVNGLGYASIGILYGIDKKILWKSIESQDVGLLVLICVFCLNIILGIRIIKKNKSKKELTDNIEQLGLTIQQLENDIDKLRRDTMEVFNEHLAAIFHKLNLSDSERISFYKFQNNKFHIIGRYSINPNLTKLNRKYYPSDEGLIGLAWLNGEYHLNAGVPECKYGTKKKYYDFIKAIAPINDDVLKKLNMKARSFYLKAFTDSKSINRVAIIVFESENLGVFNLSEIRDKVIYEEKQLVSFIERLDWELPSLNIAHQKGF